MAVTAFFYANFFKTVVTQVQSLDWDSNTIKVALTTSSYTPNQDTHDFFDDVTNEITGTGYTAGGATLGSKTNATALNVLTLDAADTSWTTSTLTARRAVVYDATGGGTAGTRPLILWVDFGADVSSTAATFSIVWDSAGLGTITAADATGFP